MNVFWYMCAPDGAYPWQPEGSRKVDLGYYKQLALAYDQLGYTGALFATGAHDVWVLAGALLSYTERLKFLVAIHPGLVAPTLLAKMAATLQEFSRGRLLINVVSGDAKMLGAYGMTMPHDERYDMADEYLQIWHRLFAGETVDFKGRHFQTEGAKLALPVGQGIEPPPLWFGGSSDKAIDVAAKHVETYLSWGETPDQIGAKVDLVKARAEKLGREQEYGIRLYVIVRDTDEEAWAAAADLYGRMDERAIAANQRFVGKTDSVGQQRMTAMHGGQKPENLRDLEIAPNLWAGIGLVRSGAGTALVGSPKTVAARLREYQEIGIDTVIASGYPHLEEAYRVSELLFPELGIKGAVPTVRASFGAQQLFGGGGHGGNLRVVSGS